MSNEDKSFSHILHVAYMSLAVFGGVVILPIRMSVCLALLAGMWFLFWKYPWRFCNNASASDPEIDRTPLLYMHRFCLTVIPIYAGLMLAVGYAKGTLPKAGERWFTDHILTENSTLGKLSFDNTAQIPAEAASKSIIGVISGPASNPTLNFIDIEFALKRSVDFSAQFIVDTGWILFFGGFIVAIAFFVIHFMISLAKRDPH